MKCMILRIIESKLSNKEKYYNGVLFFSTISRSLFIWLKHRDSIKYRTINRVFVFL